MKLILTAEVDHLGVAGDAVEVKDGYGRNYLLPRGLAIVASRGAQKQADDIRRARKSRPCATASTPTRSRRPSPDSAHHAAGEDGWRLRQVVRFGHRQ